MLLDLESHTHTHKHTSTQTLSDQLAPKYFAMCPSEIVLKLSMLLNGPNFTWLYTGSRKSPCPPSEGIHRTNSGGLLTAAHAGCVPALYSLDAAQCIPWQKNANIPLMAATAAPSFYLCTSVLPVCMSELHAYAWLSGVQRPEKSLGPWISSFRQLWAAM